MKDLIDRRDAINAVCKSECKSGFCGIPCPEVNALKALTPAQPEIIRCRDCKYWEREKPFATSGRCFIWECANRKGSDYCSEARKVSE